MKAKDLPIESVLPEIRQVLQQHDELVLQAAPGAGKTTLVPLALLQQPWLGQQKILMLEPRRMAARTAAERMASLLGEQSGETVGYRIRQQARVSAKTRIEVITEGVLTRMLQQDPELSGVGLVIFDEFHERNLNSDLGLALTLQARELLRDQPPLKLLIMSATLEGLDLSAMLDDPPQIISAGRGYPVDLIYCGTLKQGEPIAAAVVKVIERAIAETDGSILVFLPGQGEINQVKKILQPQLEPSICIHPLYGALPLDEQLKAIRPLDAQQTCRRKIVLATDIAETSITIDGISTVVDSGLARQPGFDPAAGMTRLHTRRISRASSIQRMGRAGRTRAGSCYRLWSEAAQQNLQAQTPAEILQADLCPLALQLLQWGISDPSELQWLDQPPQAAFAQALDLLTSLGAIAPGSGGGQLRLSRHGEQMTSLPLHPRLAHMLILAAQQRQTDRACALAVLLSEKDPLRQYAADISAKVDVLLGDLPCESRFRPWLKTSRMQMKAFVRLCPTADQTADDLIEEQAVIGWLISLAYPDRIAQRRSADSRNYLLCNGRAATLFKDDRLPATALLAIANLGGVAGQREDLIYAAAALDENLFETHLSARLQKHSMIEWDEKNGKMVAEQRTQLGAIVLRRERLQNIDPQMRLQAILGWIRKKGLGVLHWRDEALTLRNRIACLAQHEIATGDARPWPDVSDSGLLDSLEIWLQPFIEPVRRQQDFSKIDLQQCLLTLLPWPLPQALDELAPLKLKVPSGSTIKVDYSQSPPVLAVKLQEMFGCKQTPAIARGAIPLRLHLLSPGGKPLQITQDLAGFWRGSYHDVKKEMKGRYPKHPWPDDPLQALPTRYTKHRRRRQPG